MVEHPGSEPRAAPSPSGRTGGGAPVPVRRSERRVYLGGGAWAPAGDDGPAGRGADEQGRRRLVWPLRVVLSLPLVWGGAVSAGLGVYLLILLPTVGDPGLSTLWQVLGAAGALVVSALSMLVCGLLLRERPCCRLSLVLLGALAVALVAVVAAVVVGSDGLPLLGGAALLAYASLVVCLFWVARRTRSDSSGDPPAGPLPDRGPQGSAGLWALRSLGAVVALAAALAAGFVAFSLWAAAFISGQPELGWDETLWSAAWSSGGGEGLFRVVALILTCLGSAAAFGALVWAAARALGRWGGRISFWWIVAMGALIVLGVIFWLVDGTLPRG